MSDRLIDESSFYDSFFHEGEYGESAEWPRSSNLLYRIRFKTKTGSTQAHKLQHRSGCSSLQCERWVRIETPQQARHAEISFIEQVKDLLGCFREDKNMPVIRQVSIDIVQSYSPCSECSNELISLKNDIEKIRNPDNSYVFCDMRIKIANFYKDPEPEETKQLIDIMKLIEMVRCQIYLSVLNGLCEWKDFLENTIKLTLDMQSDRFYQTWLVRQDRELVDSIRLDCIKLAACQWVACNSGQKKDILARIRQAYCVESSFKCLTFLRQYLPRK